MGNANARKIGCVMLKSFFFISFEFRGGDGSGDDYIVSPSNYYIAKTT